MRYDLKRFWTRSGGLATTVIGLGVALGLVASRPLMSNAQTERITPIVVASREAVGHDAAELGATRLGELSEAFARVAATVRPSVVFVDAEGSRVVSSPSDEFGLPRDPFEWFLRPPGVYQRGDPPTREPFHGMGSGFIYSADGFIVTNDHVVDDAESLTVRLLDGRQFDARVVGRDPNTDIAVLKVEANNLPAMTLGDSDLLDIGEWVLAIGNPMGEEFSFTVTEGIVSAKGRGLQGLERAPYGIQDFIQTDAVINPGNSGGPLVNTEGEVVGINTAIASPTGYYAGYGFAIPANLARLVIGQLIDSGHVTRAILGVTISPATREDIDYVGLTEPGGVVVQSFGLGSPAADAGLELGDVIIAVDGHPVRSVPQLQSDVGFREPGEAVVLRVARRGGQTREYSVTLGRAPVPEDDLVASAEVRPEPEALNELGIAIAEMSSRDLERLGSTSSARTGIAIAAIVPDGPARGRLLKGDVIVAINGTGVHTSSDFETALSRIEPGDVVSLTIERPRGDGTAVSRVVRLRTRHDR